MLPPDHPRAPKFWMYEQSGVLKPVIEKYLKDEELTLREVATMRAYLRQWIDSPVWDENPDGGAAELRALRASVGRIAIIADIDDWLTQAIDVGIDPL